MVTQGNSRNATQGYTLIELLVAFALMATLAFIGFPALQKMIHRSRLEGFHLEAMNLTRMARYEAIKRGVPTVVRLNFANNRVEAYADVDDNGDFVPDTSLKVRETDYPIGGGLPLPRHVFIWAPGESPQGPSAVEGFTPHPDASFPNQIVFTRNGSVRDIGAFRFGDEVGNFLELRVSPRASGRVQLRKWDPDATEWYMRNEDGKRWQWY